jgi:glucose-6-phosphate 1-epimerase
MPNDAVKEIVLGADAEQGARAVVQRHGAHVTSWSAADGVEQLYLSTRSVMRPGSAIRGGVPIIFPQFSTLGTLPRHGFARTRAWEIVSASEHSAVLRLTDDVETRAIWPHAFDATYEVLLADDELQLSLTVANTDPEPSAFSAALHTYVRVADVADVVIDGLRGVRFRDQTAHGVERVEQAALRIEGEVDRIYVGARGPVTLREPGREMVMSAEGFSDVVVWNPGEALAATIGDLDPGGWRHFVCIEAAAIAEPVRLAPGERWTGRQRLTLVRIG